MLRLVFLLIFLGGLTLGQEEPGFFCYSPKKGYQYLLEVKTRIDPLAFKSDNLNISKEKLHTNLGDEYGFERYWTLWRDDIPCLFRTSGEFAKFLTFVPDLHSKKIHFAKFCPTIKNGHFDTACHQLTFDFESLLTDVPFVLPKTSYYCPLIKFGEGKDRSGVVSISEASTGVVFLLSYDHFSGFKWGFADPDTHQLCVFPSLSSLFEMLMKEKLPFIIVGSDIKLIGFVKFYDLTKQFKGFHTPSLR